MFKIILLVNLLTLIYGRKDMPRCGFDKLPEKFNLETNFTYGHIEELPWHGTLEHSVDEKYFRLPVVLVTVQIVVASALELSEIPKKEFRARARVFVGQNCSKSGIPIREYIYHPEFMNTTSVSIALIQLDLDNVKHNLMPICPPPDYLLTSKFYATRLYSHSDCNDVTINIYQMDYVSLEDCQAFYRMTAFLTASSWPKYPACGKATFGGNCIWLSGTALVVRQYGRWRLMGLGISGPGCEAPSKYLDYLKYRSWVDRNVGNPGRTTLTRVGDNHVILRRALSHVHRFGACDEEEMQYEIYSEKTTIDSDLERAGEATYNLTLLDTVEYSCVVLRAYHYKHKSVPRLKLRRWCASASRFCYDQHYVEIKFHVFITFQGATTYEVAAYGRQIKTMDPMKAMKYINQLAHHPRLPRYHEFKGMFEADPTGYKWVPGWQGGSYKGFKIRRYEVYEHCISNATSIFDKRFCGQYEFTVEPDRWFRGKYSASRYRHFVWRYLSQRKRLQYPIDGYEVLINADEQDYWNKKKENPDYMYHTDNFNIYDSPNYIYYIYGHSYTPLAPKDGPAMQGPGRR